MARGIGPFCAGSPADHTIGRGRGRRFLPIGFILAPLGFGGSFEAGVRPGFVGGSLGNYGRACLLASWVGGRLVRGPLDASRICESFRFWTHWYARACLPIPPAYKSCRAHTLAAKLWDGSLINTSAHISHVRACRIRDWRICSSNIAGEALGSGTMAGCFAQGRPSEALSVAGCSEAPF